MRDEEFGFTGKAYGFIYSSASEGEIKEQVPNVRDLAHTPSSLELQVHAGINPNEFRDDSELQELAQSAIRDGNNYTFVASLKGATNERTAGELGDIVNTFYNSPLQSKFLTEEGKYLGGIVSNQYGRYEFLE